MHEEPRTSIERTKSSIKNLMDETLEDADIEVLNHLHSIMLTVATDICRIYVKNQYFISTSSIFH